MFFVKIIVFILTKSELNYPKFSGMADSALAYQSMCIYAKYSYDD